MKETVVVIEIFTQLHAASQRLTSYLFGTQKLTPSFLGWIQTGGREKGGGEFDRVFLASFLGSRLKRSF